MGGGDGSSGYDEVVGACRDEGAVGDGVEVVFGDGAVVGAGSGGVVDVDFVGGAGYAVVVFVGFGYVFFGYGVETDYAAAFADADFAGAFYYVAVFAAGMFCFKKRYISYICSRAVISASVRSSTRVGFLPTILVVLRCIML